jgi:nucleoid-associated protein YgaU
MFESGPTACPFIALESDRDRRAEVPDSRHRCYAEPVPAPRAIAHQTAFCLSPDFAGCPIFRDWAVRAAATPVPIPPAYGRPGEAEPGSSTEPEQIELLPAAGPAESIAEPGTAAALDAQPEADRERVREEPPAQELPVHEPPMAEAALEVPAFLASRAGQLNRAGRPAPPPIEPLPTSVPVEPVAGQRVIGRDELIPSWERDRDFAARGDGRLGDWLATATKALIALALVALVVLAIILAPGLLAGGPQPTQPAVVASPTPAVSPTSPVNFTPEPTTEPSASAGMQTYTIKAGDSLTAIASQFGLTIDQLLAANPQITDPNTIRAGDVVNIPPDDFGLDTPTP